MYRPILLPNHRAEPTSRYRTEHLLNEQRTEATPATRAAVFSVGTRYVEAGLRPQWNESANRNPATL